MPIVPRLPHVQADAVIIDHVFQPIVDWLGIDPERWSRRLFRVFALGIITCAASMAAMTSLGMLGLTVFDGFFAVPIGLFSVIFAIDRMLRYPSYPPFELVGPFIRLPMLASAIWFLPVIVLSVVGEADGAAHDAAGNTPFILRMASFGLSIALPAGASALYVRICRRPPPRRPRRSTVTA